jgi:hypothetical protein
LNAGKKPSSGLAPAGFCKEVAKRVESGKRKKKNSQPIPGISNKYGVLDFLFFND